MMRFGSLLTILLLASLGLNAWLLLDKFLVTPTIEKTRPLSSLSPLERLVLAADSRNNGEANAGGKKGLESLLRSRATESKENLSADDLQILFDAGEFIGAIEAWQWLASNDQTLAEQIKRQWLLIAGQWLETGALESTRLLFEAWLRQYPYDLAFRGLQAQWLAASGDRLAAIEKYYSLLNESVAAEQGRYAGAISKLVDAEVTALADQQAWHPLIRFIERLLWHEPQHPPYILMLAKAHIELKQYGQATTLLQSIAYNEYYEAQVNDLLEAIALKNLRAEAIALTPQNEHYLVDGQINNATAVNLLIDTGASVSVISERYFRQVQNRLSPTFIRQAKITTAGGIVDAPVYQFSSFAIGEYRLRNMQFVVMELEGKGQGDGLLGMNFLKAFDFRIDQQNNLLLLNPR